MECEQEADDGGTEDAEFLKHLSVGDARGDAFVDGDFPGGEHDAVDEGGDGDESDFVNPFEVVEEDDQDSAEDKPARPAGVEDVEPFGFVMREHGGDNGVDEGFDGPVGQSEDQAAPVEVLEGGLLVGGVVGGSGHTDPGEVTEECEIHGDFVANAIDDETEEDDTDCEGPDPDADESSGLCGVEAVEFGPFTDQKQTSDEAEGGGDEGDEASPEEEVGRFFECSGLCIVGSDVCIFDGGGIDGRFSFGHHFSPEVRCVASIRVVVRPGCQNLAEGCLETRR